MKPHRGTLILVFGILGIVLCGPLAIAAWVMGNGDLKEMDAGTMDPSGRSNIIGTILWGLGTLAWVALVALGILGAALSQQ